MLPSNSNLAKETCNSISSNCVIWQGPDIPCLSLCTGDSITDVVYKLAVDYCAVKDSLNLEELDVSKLLAACGGTNFLAPDQKTLFRVLEIIIEKINCLANQ